MKASSAPSSVLALVCLCWFGIVRGLFINTQKVVSDTDSLVVLLDTHIKNRFSTRLVFKIGVGHFVLHSVNRVVAETCSQKAEIRRAADRKGYPTM